MTADGTASAKAGRGVTVRQASWRGIISLLAISGVVVTALFLSSDIEEFAAEGLRLAVERVLPTTLPFMVISGFAASLITPESLPRLSRLLALLFGVSEEGVSALIIGNLTGFPIGSKMTAEIYSCGRLDKREAECLSAYSSNPSAPFVVSTVGAGLLGDLELGVILLISLMAGTLLSAQVFRGKCSKMSKTTINARQKYSFVDSVRGAAEASVSMIAFITVFFTASKMSAKILGSTPLSALIILFSEVTGAVSFIADFSDAGAIGQVGLCAFALGFGGVSVMLQSAAFSTSAGLGLKRYFCVKICEGVFSALVAMLLCFLLHN